MSSPELLRYDLAPGVLAFSTTRRGGVSKGQYGEFNINRHCGDNAADIAENGRLLCQQLGIAGDRLVMPHQTHGTVVRRISADFFVLDAASREAFLDGVDAIMTDISGVCVGVSTADCIPVLLCDTARHACCAVHAGWRGTVERIVCKAVDALCEAYGTRPADLRTVIGPGISLDSFEVGDEVYDRFAAAGFDMPAISRRMPAFCGDGDKWHIDLWTCNRLQLERCGVPPSAIHLAAIDTFTHHDMFFSARRLGIKSGRIFNGIVINY